LCRTIILIFTWENKYLEKEFLYPQLEEGKASDTIPFSKREIASAVCHAFFFRLRPPREDIILSNRQYKILPLNQEIQNKEPIMNKSEMVEKARQMGFQYENDY
jgi:hypothetical protein